MTTLLQLRDALSGVETSDDETMLVQTQVVDATHDSRQAGPGVLFCAVPGAVTDGHDHAPEAVRNGAPALLVERRLNELAVPQLVVEDVRASMGPAASVVHGDPSRDLAIVGVTGTNGKTTTAYLLEYAFGAAGWGTGIIGTVETRIHGEPTPGVRTTPESTDLQRLFAVMRDRGVDGVAMEVSSHGLVLHRVAGTTFEVAVFTNLSQDHLDFHGTMDDYYAAKASLFTRSYARSAVVCVDDDWGRRLAAETELPVTTYGTSPDADVVISSITTELSGTVAHLADGSTVRTRLVGDVNALNAVGAVLAATAAGIESEAARDGVAACPGVPGRLERVPAASGPAVLVDYAHTPDALSRAIGIVRDLTDGRVIVVIGCGGDRDRDKRPKMGAAALAADLAILTSDNPRSEDPDTIIAEMRRGAEQARTDGARGEFEVEPDRRAAISAAIGRAEEGDVVLVAGKGHETGQEFADRTIPFDDRVVAGELLAARMETT